MLLTSSIVRRRQWHPTPVLLPGKSRGWRSLVGCSPWGCEESDTTERLHFHFSLSCIGEGNGNPLQCSCLENPVDGGAWWAAVHGVAQSPTGLKRLSSSSSSSIAVSGSWIRTFSVVSTVLTRWSDTKKNQRKLSWLQKNNWWNNISHFLKIYENIFTFYVFYWTLYYMIFSFWARYLLQLHLRFSSGIPRNNSVIAFAVKAILRSLFW